MANVITSIGTRSPEAVTVNSVSGAGPWDLVLSGEMSNTIVGDTIVGDGDSDFWLITVIDGVNITVADHFAVGFGPSTGAHQTDNAYNTMTLWEADLDDSDMYSSGDVAIGHAYAAIYDEFGLVINNGGGVGLGGIRLTSPIGHRHSGIQGVGARMVCTTNPSASGILIERPNVSIQFLELDANSNLSSIRCIYQGGSYDSATIQHCIIHDHRSPVPSYAFGMDIRLWSVSSGSSYINNNLIYDMYTNASGASTVIGILALTNSAGDATVKVQNNLVDRCVNDNGSADARGIHTSDVAGSEVTGNMACGTGGTTSGAKTDYLLNAPSNAPFSYNLSSDGTASGTGSLTSKAMTAQVISNTNGSENYHLVGSADAYQASVDLGTSPNDVNLDINSYDRDAAGSVWSMGPDQGPENLGTQLFPWFDAANAVPRGRMRHSDVVAY